VLHRSSLLCRFVDILVPDFENFMFPDKESFGGRIYPEMSCELNCTSNGFSCTFLDLAVKQSPQGISCDIFHKCFQPEYAGIDMICMPHVHSKSLLVLSWALSIFSLQVLEAL
jgi:hypothetical protein